MMRTIIPIFLAIIFLQSSAIAQEIIQTDFVEAAHIQVLSSKISDSKAKDLADHFNAVGRSHMVEPRILAAIAFQESSFRYSIISGNDIGLFQLNYYWQVVKKNRIREYSIEQLNEDWKLNTKLAADHLSDCREKHPANSRFSWWVCFHSQTYKYQKIYHSRVRKHLQKMETIP